MRNTETLATAHVSTPGGVVTYAGAARIDGVPGTHAAIPLEFNDTAGSSCGALLPTGNVVDDVDGLAATFIDNGMPVAIVAAPTLGVTGYEAPAELETNTALCRRIEALRLKAGVLMGLGDVTTTTVPKICIVAAPAAGGSLATRMFIPRRVLAQLGGFDDRFFLIWEDVDLSVRARNLGHDILLVPQSRIYHKVSATLRGMSAVGTYYYVRNRMLIARLYSQGAYRRLVWTLAITHLREALRRIRRSEPPAMAGLSMTIRAIFDHIRNRYGALAR
jgi:hypothetical protein